MEVAAWPASLLNLSREGSAYKVQTAVVEDVVAGAAREALGAAVQVVSARAFSTKDHLRA
jgi:hypothetical protein